MSEHTEDVLLCLKLQLLVQLSIVMFPHCCHPRQRHTFRWATAQVQPLNSQSMLLMASCSSASRNTLCRASCTRELPPPRLMMWFTSSMGRCLFTNPDTMWPAGGSTRGHVSEQQPEPAAWSCCMVFKSGEHVAAPVVLVVHAALSMPPSVASTIWCHMMDTASAQATHKP